MFVELGLITLGYCLIVCPAYAALCGFLKGKFESDIALAPRRERVAYELEKLEAKFAREQAWLNKSQQQQAQQQALQNKKSKKRKKNNSVLPLFSKLTQPQPQSQRQAKGPSRSSQAYVNPVKGRIVQRRGQGTGKM